MCFGTFWMRAYFRSVPRSMLEAAEIDGAGSVRTLFSVALPPGRPAVLTLILFTFMASWNEFLFPLVMVTSENLRTAPLGLAFFAGQHSTDRIGQAAAARHRVRARSSSSSCSSRGRSSRECRPAR